MRRGRSKRMLAIGIRLSPERSGQSDTERLLQTEQLGKYRM
jgi:hypothetical protein